MQTAKLFCGGLNNGNFTVVINNVLLTVEVADLLRFR